MFLSLLRNTMSRGLQGRARRQPIGRRFRPQLEALEGRDVPSTLYVTSNLGFGTGTLRAEIAAAQSGDTIKFDPSLSGQRIDVWSNGPWASLGGIELVIDKSLDIEGLGATNLAINGGNVTRVFHVTAGVQVTLSGLTIENGNGKAGGWDPAPNDDMGGSILNFGTLTVNGCQVHGDGVNANANYGGGIYNAGTLNLLNSTVTHNVAQYAGGGIYNAGTLNALASAVIDNFAPQGPNVFGHKKK